MFDAELHLAWQQPVNRVEEQEVKRTHIAAAPVGAVIVEELNLHRLGDGERHVALLVVHQCPEEGRIRMLFQLDEIGELLQGDATRHLNMHVVVLAIYGDFSVHYYSNFGRAKIHFLGIRQ